MTAQNLKLTLVETPAGRCAIQRRNAASLAASASLGLPAHKTPAQSMVPFTRCQHAAEPSPRAERLKGWINSVARSTYCHR